MKKVLFSLPFVLVLYGLMLVYNVVGEWSVILQTPYGLLTVIDTWIPYVSWFAPIYTLWMLFPIALLLLATHKKITAQEMIGLYLANILLILLSFFIYLFFPTSAESIMILPGEGVMNQLVQFLYAAGVPYNAFPSYHVASMTLITMFLFFKARRWFWAFLPIAILISLSTVFIKYHFFVDILGGIVIGVFAYYVLYEKLAQNIMKRVSQKQVF